MKRFLAIPLFFAMLCTSATAQEIILLNQDGEKVGVAKEGKAKSKNKDNKIVQIEVIDDGDSQTKSDNTSAKIENGVITVTGPDGKVQEFKMSDSQSVIINRSSKTVVDENGNRKVEATGKAIVVGPDGVRREIDLGNGNASAGSLNFAKAPKTWMIGITCDPVSPVLRSQLRIDGETGLVVTSVLSGSAAEKGGFEVNDILMFANGKPVAEQKELSKIVNEAGKVDKSVDFTLLRGGEEVSVTVKPAEREGINQMMLELGPGMKGFKMNLPDFGDDLNLLEFQQFGPGIIIGNGKTAIDVQRDLMGDFEEKIQRMQEQMEELRRSMQNEDR